MRTLFNPNILTSSPTPIPEPTTTNPFELVFATSLSLSNTNSTASSSFSKSPKFGLLTNRLQDESQNTANAETHRATTYRRKGHPKLLMMGQRRSGKSSIQSVIFQKMAPAETLFLESTNTIKASTMHSFTTFEVLELPSNMSLDSTDIDRKSLFSQLGAVLWVIDVQDEYLSSIAALVKTATFLEEHYPRVHLEVLIHKTDGLSDEYRHDASREVRQRVEDEFSDVGLAYHAVAFHQTSIFDHSIFEAMSKIVQKLLLQLESLESMLNRLCSTCGMQKAFLFDTTSKLFVATDTSPLFLGDYEACSDYLDVLIDLKTLYSWSRPRDHHDSKHARTVEENLGESVVTYEQTGDTYIYARELTEYLTLICILSKGSGVGKRVLIDYNVSILQEAVVKVFSI